MRVNPISLVLFFLIAILMFVACPTTDEPEHVLNLKIDKDNDSLLTFDSLIVTVHSKDGSYAQEVFHGVLRNAKQVTGLPLDARIGKEFKVSIVGYKGGKIGVNKEVTIYDDNTFQSKDLSRDTVVIKPSLPEILTPSDTSMTEGDSLGFPIRINNPLAGIVTLSLKEAIPGLKLAISGGNPGEGFLSWKPGFDQGRPEAYVIILVYANSDTRVEKSIQIKVLNSNRPPKLSAILDQKAKENESLSFKVEASDPDNDSITLTAMGLPDGATFSAGTFTWKPSMGQAGNHPVKFRAFDGIDSDLVVVLVTVGNVDVSPPVDVKITSPSRDTTVNFTPITILYTVNGTPLQRQVALKDGKSKIFIDTTIGGRTGLDTITITLDTVPPGKPIVTGTSPVRTRTPAWSWTSGGGGIDTYRYRLDSEDMSGSTVLTETAYTASKDLDPGAHTLFVQERDAAGNWSATGKYPIRIDTTRPTPPQLTITPTTPTNNPLPTWNWNGTGDDLSGLYRYKLDTNDFRSGGIETRLTHFTPEKEKSLKEGLHTLYVQQQDSAGNWSNAGSASIFIDLTAPGKPKVTPLQSSPTNTSRPTWNISNGEGGMGFFRARIDDTNMTQGTRSGSFTGFTPDSALAHGTHTLYVQERDSAGNWSATQSAALLVDLVAPSTPVFDSLPLSPLNSLQPSWSWKSGGGGMGTFRCKLDDSTMGQASDTIKTVSFKSTEVLAEGLHTLYVQERDTAGNWSRTSARPLVLSVRKILGTAGFSPSVVYMSSLAFSKAGVPYVAFRDDSHEGKLSVMRFMGTGWEIVGAAGLSNGVAENIRLRITDSDLLYVSFQDWGNENKASVMRFVLDSWGYVGPAGLSPGETDFNSLALSSTGMPYVAFRDGSQAGKVTVMRFNSGTWEKVGAAGFSTGTVQHVSLALSSDNVPYIAFENVINFNKSLTVMRLNGTTWESVGTTGLPALSAFNPSLTVIGTTPYIAFEDNAHDDKATVMRFVSGAWQNVGTGTISASGGFSPFLAADKAGLPYVAFQDGANGEKATVMRYNGNTWDAVGGFGITAGAMLYPSLALSPLGVPYLSCSDGSNGNKITVLKTSFDP